MLACNDLLTDFVDAKGLRLMWYHVSKLASNMISRSIRPQTVQRQIRMMDECFNLQVHEFGIRIALLHIGRWLRAKYVRDAVLLLCLDVYSLLPSQMVCVVTHILQNGFNK